MKGFWLLLALAGCTQIDPYTRTGMWQPDGVNQRNLAVMAARPVDLLAGHGDAGAQPVLAIAAANRLLEGVPKPLPSLDDGAALGAKGAGAAAAPGAH